MEHIARNRRVSRAADLGAVVRDRQQQRHVGQVIDGGGVVEGGEPVGEFGGEQSFGVEGLEVNEVNITVNDVTFPEQ
jgi:hypothetical protein